MRRLGGTLRMTGKALPEMLWGAALLLHSVAAEGESLYDLDNQLYFYEDEDPGIIFAAGDFNADEYADFIVISQAYYPDDDSVEVFLGAGSGDFLALGNISTLGEITYWLVGNFDNDAEGLDDLFILTYDMPETACVYLSTGDGQFAPPLLVPGFNLFHICNYYTTPGVVADFDADGFLDVSLAFYDSIEVYLGAGDGTFTKSYAAERTFPASVTAADLNNDGDLDLITLLRGAFSVYPGTGDGTFAAPSYYGGFEGPSEFGDICAGDLNEDGWLDIALSAGGGIGTYTLFVFLNKGDGTFSDNGPDYYYLDGSQYNDVFLEDLDLDGHLDFGVSSGYGPGQILIAKGVGDGSFPSPVFWELGFGGIATARSDFDGDGDTDIALRGVDDSYPRPYPPGIYVLSNETIQQGVEGGEAGTELLSLRPSSNPFSSSVTLICEGDILPGQLMVYDVTGRLIRSLSDRQDSSFTWDGRDAAGDQVPAGTYLIQGAVEGQVSSIRLVRL